MRVVSSALTNLSSFLQDHHVSFSNGLLILFTVGGEHIFKLGAFKCPSAQPEAKYYSLVFFVIPALVLCLMGLAVSNLTWRILHGCCGREREHRNGPGKVFRGLLTSFARAAVVPVAWVFLMFLEGNYLACMKSANPSDTESQEYKEWISYSQRLGWCLLLGVVLFCFTVIAIVRCCDSVTYEKYKYIIAYREIEEAQFDTATREHTKEKAKKSAEDFIKNEAVLAKRDWDAISVVPDHSGTSLSPLDVWAKTRKQPAAQQEHPKELSKETIVEVINNPELSKGDGGELSGSSLSSLDDWAKRQNQPATQQAQEAV